MTEEKKVIDIKPKKIIYCPDCSWGGFLKPEYDNVYWCGKCMLWWTRKSPS